MKRAVLSLARERSEILFGLDGAKLKALSLANVPSDDRKVGQGCWIAHGVGSWLERHVYLGKSGSEWAWRSQQEASFTSPAFLLALPCRRATRSSGCRRRLWRGGTCRRQRAVLRSCRT